MGGELPVDPTTPPPTQVEKMLVHLMSKIDQQSAYTRERTKALQMYVDEVRKITYSWFVDKTDHRVVVEWMVPRQNIPVQISQSKYPRQNNPKPKYPRKNIPCH